MTGKNINYFLMDGTASGRIKCTIVNWTGIAYRIPRTEVEHCRKREDLNQSGVYFLFGMDEDMDREVVYVGQAGDRGVLTRLQEHLRNAEKDYWTEAIIFTTQNNSFGPTEISWLESYFCKLARTADRFEVKNGNEPNGGNVTEEKQSELEEFAEYAKIVMGVLGRKVFEPLVIRENTKYEKDTVAITQKDIIVDGGEKLYFVRRNGSDARCVLTDEGIVVLEGSVISPSTNKSCPEAAKTRREKEKANIGDDWVLKKAVKFSSPSGAAQFILGASVAGPLVLKNEAGQTLKNVESGEA